MPGGLHGQRVGNNFSGALVVFHPGWVREGDPNGVPVDEELDVHGVGVTGGNGHDQRLVHHVDGLSGPAVDTVEVSVHRRTYDDKRWHEAGEARSILRAMLVPVLGFVAFAI